MNLCPLCQTELRWVEDGCMTDLGWKDESYFECPLHGEEFDCGFPVAELVVERSGYADITAPVGIEAAVGQIVRELGLSAGELEAFQNEVCRQRRNWRLVLTCAFDAGCRGFKVLIDFVLATRG